MKNKIKLIIEITEEVYEYWKTHKEVFVLAEAIEKGVLLDDVKAEIQENMYCDKDTRLVENANASGLKKALEIIDNIGKGDK